MHLVNNPAPVNIPERYSLESIFAPWVIQGIYIEDSSDNEGWRTHLIENFAGKLVVALETQDLGDEEDAKAHFHQSKEVTERDRNLANRKSVEYRWATEVMDGVEAGSLPRQDILIMKDVMKKKKERALQKNHSQTFLIRNE